MASFFKVPADWEFSQSEEYETQHPGSAVNFGLRKSARKGNLGAYLYRYPGDWSFEQIEKQASAGKGGALDYELGQWTPMPAAPPDYKFAFRMVDRLTKQPIANQELHIRIENSATAPTPAGFTESVKTNAEGVAKIIMSGSGSSVQYLSLTPYRPNVARGSNKAIIWRFPITLGASDPVPLDIIDQPGGGVQHDFPGAPPRPQPSPSAILGNGKPANFGTILGIGVLVIGIGFLGYQLYKGAKVKKAVQAPQPA